METLSKKYAYSDVKNLIEDIEYYTNSIQEAKEIAKDVINYGYADNGNYRVLEIDDAMREIEDTYHDPYILGSFTSWFIADNTDLSIDIVEALQDAGKYEFLGSHIINNDYFESFIDEAVRIDGISHYINSYDGTYHEFEFGGYEFVIFKS